MSNEKSLKDRLESYFCNQKEIELLGHQIEDEKNKTEIAGSYQYSSEFTGQQRERVIMMATGDFPTVANLSERKRKLIAECEELDSLVFNIPDSEIRQILTIGYLMSESDWEKVADHFGRDISGRAYREKAKRFLEKYDSACRLCSSVSNVRTS